MATAQTYKVKVLEHARVSPPPGSVANDSVLLSFFDVLWLEEQPVQRLFFYEYLHSTSHFLENYLPSLKSSLSLSLKIFYPLAGNLTHCPETNDHYIHYTDGNSVPLTIAESDGDFYGLAANHARIVTDFHPLVPHLPKSESGKDPLMALQITVFPYSGICLGISINHTVADGSSTMHFMKSWALTCRSGGDVSEIISLPIINRAFAKSLEQIKRNHFKQMEKLNVKDILKHLNMNKTHITDTVLVTFLLTRSDLNSLRQHVLAKAEPSQKSPHYSSFVLTCAYVWVCLVKARNLDGDKDAHFAFAVDCRSRLDPPLPSTYCGNCIGACFSKEKASNLTGEDGLVNGSEAIRRAIHELGNGSVLKDADIWVPRFLSLLGELVITVAGSPRFGVYETDFGWGRPKKVEVISIEHTGAISLAESGDGEGGIEIGLVLPKVEMDRFAAFFREGLKQVNLDSPMNSK